MPDPSDPDWEDLIRQVEAASGSEAGGGQGWAELTERLRALGRSLAVRYPSLTPELAEDLVQNVLLELLQSPERLRWLRASRSPWGYLSVLMRNRLIDSYRRREVERRFVAELPRPLPEPESPEPDPHAPSPETLALRRLLAQLPDDDRRLLHLRFWERRPIGEVADDLGISYSAAATRMFRLLRRLRAEIDP